MGKNVYLATGIAVIAAIALILSSGVSYFTDTEEVTYNTFTAGVSDSCTGRTCYGADLWWQYDGCTDGGCCDIYNHISYTDAQQCRSDCAVATNCTIGCDGASCNCNDYQECLVGCLNDYSDEMASCKRVPDEGGLCKGDYMVKCTCYCHWGGGEP